VVSGLDSRVDGRKFDSRPQRLVGDHLRAGKLPHYFIKPPKQIQPPTLSEMGSKGSKGRYGSFHLSTTVWVAGKTVRSFVNTLTRSIPERLINKRYTN